jgi:RNA polymerase sigma-70 factor (ECF subfamily)
VALNLSRDLLRRRKRREYVGPWLPSPIASNEEPSPPSHEPVVDGGRTLEDRYDLLESVSFAFLLALERLTPTQRAVLLLRDVFDYSVAETAGALDLSESNVKTTHHRARHALEEYDRTRRPRTASLAEQTRQTLATFLRRLEANDVAGVEAMLAADVKATTDGGGVYRAALRTIVGRDKVVRFFLGIAKLLQDLTVRPLTLNGLPALLVDVGRRPDRGAPRSTLQIDLDAEGRIKRIYSVSAPAKMTALQQATAT